MQQAAAAAAAAAGGGGGSAASSGSAGAEAEAVPNLRIQKHGGTLLAELVDLPPMTDVAAGFSHIAFTDGSSVWTIGRRARGARGVGST